MKKRVDVPRKSLSGWRSVRQPHFDDDQDRFSEAMLEAAQTTSLDSKSPFWEPPLRQQSPLTDALHSWDEVLEVSLATKTGPGPEMVDRYVQQASALSNHLATHHQVPEDVEKPLAEVLVGSLALV